MTIDRKRHVITRSGDEVPFYFDRITAKLDSMSQDLDIDTTLVTQKVAQSIYDGVHTREIDEMCIKQALYMGIREPDFETLASRLIVDNLNRTTQRSFSDVTEDLSKLVRDNRDLPEMSPSDYEVLVKHMRPQDESLPFLNEEYHEFVKNNAEKLDSMVRHDRDRLFNSFGLKTMMKSYLLKDKNGKILERPQHMLMRVATFLGMPHIEDIEKTYENLSLLKMTFATPTLFNAGLFHSQLSSCFLVSMDDDLGDMFDKIKSCAMISKYSGGIGIDISSLRCDGSRIYSTGGKSDGLPPFVKVLNDVARYVNQGGGKRKGSFAVYLSPTHPDFMKWLTLRKSTTTINIQCFDIHQGIMMPDLFMKRVEAGEMWSFFDPALLPNLNNLYGEEFEKVYETAEKNKMYHSQMPATEVMEAILQVQLETGEPYIAFKDSINRKSNQKNRGTIKLLNLCAEIAEYTDKENIAVCNLASVCLPRFFRDGRFRFDEFAEVVDHTTVMMNRVLDRNFYPTTETTTSNKSMRPIGIGVQGLADLYHLYEYAWSDPEAYLLNKKIFATLYSSALRRSCLLAEKEGSYDYFEGSPLSQGLLQPDLWNVEVVPMTQEEDGHEIDWNALRELGKRGCRNSLLVALMPTASTSQIFGNNECFEPYTSNIYTREVLSGTFPVVNRHLYRYMKEHDLWTERNVEMLMLHDGRVKDLPFLDARTKIRFASVWDIAGKVIVQQAIDRGAYVCQSQSLNLFYESGDGSNISKKLYSALMYGWKGGLKTGMYYLRQLTAEKRQQTTLRIQEGMSQRSRVSQSEDSEECLTCSA